MIPALTSQLRGFPAELGQDVNPMQVVFMTPEEKELSMAARVVKAAEETSAPLKVKVVAPYRISVEGKHYVGGDVLEVPDDAEHTAWLQSGWAELLKEK